MHYYQFNIGNYRRDTQHLSLLEHGIYRLLLDQYYLTEKPINANALRLICVRNADDVQTAMRLLSEFFQEVEPGEFVHQGCDKVIDKFKEKSLKASTSAKTRWDANAMRTHSEGNANHKPITINQEPITNNQVKPKPTADKSALDDGFETFWKAYPRKTGKGYAATVWAKTKPPKDLILRALSWQSDSEQWRKDGGQFVPNPATYLNQKRWLDEPPPTHVSGMTAIGRRAADAASRWLESQGAISETH